MGASLTTPCLGDVRAGVAPSATWRQLAEHKLPEVDALIEQAQTMRQMLEHGLACDCGSLRECAITITR